MDESGVYVGRQEQCNAASIQKNYTCVCWVADLSGYHHTQSHPDVPSETGASSPLTSLDRGTVFGPEENTAERRQMTFTSV